MHLRVSGGVTEKAFLNIVPAGTKVDLSTKARARTITRTLARECSAVSWPRASPWKDDFSGRQRWTITRGSGDWYNIRSLGGPKGRVFLSVSASGDKAVKTLLRAPILLLFRAPEHQTCMVSVFADRSV